jgi:hypothetical protein
MDGKSFPAFTLADLGRLGRMQERMMEEARKMERALLITLERHEALVQSGSQHAASANAGASKPMPELKAIDRTYNRSGVKSSRGRRPKADWDGSVKNFVFEQLDDNGWPLPGDAGWSCQADVERAVADHIEKTCGASICESQVRHHTHRLMSEWFEWKQKKAGK